MKTSIKRIYHPYWKWEETRFNMWGSVSNRNQWLKKAICFTGDYILYGLHMIKVVNEWKYSCEHNLSDKHQNRQAWIGHAACALAMQCPEDIIRQAWGFLTDEQRSLANKQADIAIKVWEERQCQKKDWVQMFLPLQENE